MKTLKLETPLEYVGRYVEVGGKLHLVRGLSDDRKTLSLEEMGEINPDAPQFWSGCVIPSDESADNPE